MQPTVFSQGEEEQISMCHCSQEPTFQQSWLVANQDDQVSLEHF